MAKKEKKPVEEEEEQYHVEVITKARVNSEGDWDYYVKWAGYGPENDSWEPAENVEGCERLLKSFWRHIGMDNEDYEEGYVVEASEEWIENEKAFFHEHFGKPEEPTKKKKKRRDSKTKPVIGKAIVKKNAKGKATFKKPQIEDSDSDYEESSEEDIPISSRPKAAKRVRRTRSVSSSDDSDVPLRKVPRKSSLSTPKQAKRDSISTAKFVKGKETVRPRPRTPEREHDPLFSEPSSPEVHVNKKKMSEPVPDTSTSKAASGSAGPQKSATIPQPPPPRQPAPSHKNNEPRVKVMPLQIAGDAAKMTDTKRRIAERAGTISKPATSVAKPDPLKILNFKKNKTTTNDSQASPATPHAGPSHDARRLSNSWLPGAQVVDSPVDEGGPWSAGGAWGRAQSPSATGGWGNTASAHSPTAAGSWGTTTGAQSPTAAGGWGTATATWSPTAGGGWGTTAGGQSPVSAGGWGNTARAHSPISAGAWGGPARAGSGSGVAPRQTSPTAPVPHVDRPPDPRKVAMAARRQSTSQEPPPNRKEAEAFLASIMPAQLAAPMPEPTGNQMDVDLAPAPKSILKKPILPQTRIPKKWQWEGELHMRTSPDESEPPAKLCSIVLSEPTEPRPNGLRLNLCYTSQTSTIRLEKLHDITDVYMLLRACAPIQQYCKILPKAAEDTDVLNAFSVFLGHRRKFTYTRVHMDDNQVGVLLIVHASPSSSDICDALKVPSQFRDFNLAAILIPWRITAEQFQAYEWQGSHSRLSPDAGLIAPDLVAKVTDFSRKRIADPRLAQGLRVHHFTAADRDFFTRAERKYCVWTDPSDGSPGAPGFETQLLDAVLAGWNAKKGPPEKEARVIFVHVGSLHTLHKLHAVALRKAKQPEVRFYSYGTHPSVPPHRWGIREIYPVGGVVTFSARAIVEDPFKVCDLIEKLHEHPLWLCYVHPFVLAVVAKMSYPGSDPASLIRQDNFFYRPLLDLIEEGKVSLLEAPPKSLQARTASNDTSRMIEPSMQWAEWCLSLCGLDAAEIMEECMQFFNQRHAELPQKDMAPVADQLLIKDLLQMQLEPTMMDEYRRFVMVHETRNDPPREIGLEFQSISQEFEFRDDYFSKS